MGHRDAGTIFGAKAVEDNEHGGFTFSIWIEYDTGSSQCFGSAHFDEAGAEAASQEIAAAFGVKNFSDLKGKRCFALKHFSGWNELVDGIESESTGRRWMVADFARRYYPKVKREHPLEARKKSIVSTIEQAEKRIAQAERDLEKIEDDFRDWT